ncbi:hypothetical protein AB1N83_013485 [Pleurotus pulmonarius]
MPVPRIPGRRGVGPAIQRGTAMGLRGWHFRRPSRARDVHLHLHVHVVHLPYRRRLHHILRASSTRRRPLASCGIRADELLLRRYVSRCLSVPLDIVCTSLPCVRSRWCLPSFWGRVGRVPMRLRAFVLAGWLVGREGCDRQYRMGT